MKIILEYKDILSMALSIVVMYVSLSGLHTWKRKLKGNTEYEHARKLLRATYKVREAIQHVRNPFMSGAEQFFAMEESGIETGEMNKFDAEHREKSLDIAYQKRWQKIVEAMTELDIEAFEGEVLWGKEVNEALIPIRHCTGELHWGIQMLLLKKESKLPDAEQRRMGDIIYSFENLATLQSPEEIKNVFSLKLIKAVIEFEDFIRPKMVL